MLKSRPTVVHIPFLHFENSTHTNWSRSSLIDFVEQEFPGSPREVLIVVTEKLDLDGTDIEIARIELNATLDAKWRLQYVSHPMQSRGLTANISPTDSDLQSYLQLLQAENASELLMTESADVLEDEGLGPLANLNLRLEHPAPLLPSQAMLAKLVALGGSIFRNQFRSG